MQTASRSQFVIYASSIAGMIVFGLGYVNLLGSLKPVDELIVIASFCLTGLLFVVQALRGSALGTHLE